MSSKEIEFSVWVRITDILHGRVCKFLEGHPTQDWKSKSDHQLSSELLQK
jgi:hypothetical protein